MSLDIQSKRHYLYEWASSHHRSRWDYDDLDYTLEDIFAAADRFFRGETDRLRAGDYIHVTAADNKRATLIVNLVDKVRNTVAYDVDVVHGEKVILAPGSTYTLRYRGPRGGFYCVMDAAGKVVSGGHRSEEEASRKMAMLLESKAAA